MRKGMGEGGERKWLHLEYFFFFSDLVRFNGIVFILYCWHTIQCCNEICASKQNEEPQDNHTRYLLEQLVIFGRMLVSDHFKEPVCEYFC